MIEKARNKLIGEERPASGDIGSILDFHLYFYRFCLKAIDRPWLGESGAFAVVRAARIAGELTIRF